MSQRFHLAAIVTFIALAALTACNTMEGMGRDIERTGDKLEDTAREQKNR